MKNFNYLLRGSVAFLVAALAYLSIVLRNRKVLSAEIDKYADKAPDRKVSEEEKTQILVKTHQMIMKPLKTMMIFFVIGIILGIIGIFTR